MQRNMFSDRILKFEPWRFLDRPVVEEWYISNTLIFVVKPLLHDPKIRPESNFKILPKKREISDHFLETP